MRILLAEDERSFGRVLRAELEERGYEVEVAPDGVEAVLHTIAGGFDFFLLDVRMPRLDGINALRIMRRLAPRTPAIVYSGNAGSGEIAESLRAGATRCLVKPFSIAQLVEEIERHGPRRAAPAP